MITDPAIPRMRTAEGGGVRLCHGCQRELYFCGGYVEMLIRDVQRLAKWRGYANRNLHLTSRSAF